MLIVIIYEAVPSYMTQFGDGTLGITQIDHGGEGLRQYQHLHPSAPSDTAEWVEMVVLPYLVVTITELSHLTWHGLVKYLESTT